MKRYVTILACSLIAAASAGAQSVGGGFSFWVPESLYTGQGGSVGVETALGSSVSFGELFSAPFGLAYNKVYGLQVEGSDIAPAEPWFVADTLLGFVMAKARIGLGPLYLDLFGGGAGVWNMSLVPLVSTIEESIAGASEAVAFAAGPVITGGTFGWGWQAGGGIGVQVGPVAVDLNVTYRMITSPATVEGSYYTVQTAGPTVTGPTAYGPIDILIRLAGLTVGIDATFQM